MEKLIIFNPAEVEVKDLNQQIMNVSFGKSLGNFIYLSCQDLSWFEIAQKIHAEQAVELSDEKAKELCQIVIHPECRLNMAVKLAIINHITNLLKQIIQPEAINNQQQQINTTQPAIPTEEQQPKPKKPYHRRTPQEIAQDKAKAAKAARERAAKARKKAKEEREKARLEKELAKTLKNKKKRAYTDRRTPEQIAAQCALARAAKAAKREAVQTAAKQD